METPVVRYQERQWVPWWIYPSAFLVGAAAVFVVGGIDVLTSQPPPLLPLLLVAVGLGGYVVLFSLFSRGMVTLDDEALRVGRERIPLDEIVEVRPLRGRDVGRVRSELVGFGVGTTRAGLLGSVIPGAALGAWRLAVGVDILRNLNRRRGMKASVWQRSAVLVRTPGYRTKVWLIATRQPEALIAAIESALEAGGYGACQTEHSPAPSPSPA